MLNNETASTVYAAMGEVVSRGAHATKNEKNK
jgi:hypothetical protein